jgi:hypothetical protein
MTLIFVFHLILAPTVRAKEEKEKEREKENNGQKDDKKEKRGESDREKESEDEGERRENEECKVSSISITIAPLPLPSPSLSPPPLSPLSNRDSSSSIVPTSADKQLDPRSVHVTRTHLAFEFALTLSLRFFLILFFSMAFNYAFLFYQRYPNGAGAVMSARDYIDVVREECTMRWCLPWTLNEREGENENVGFGVNTFLVYFNWI